MTVTTRILTGTALTAALPEVARLHWLESGDHDWIPRRDSGRDQASLIDEGGATIADFMSDHS